MIKKNLKVFFLDNIFEIDFQNEKKILKKIQTHSEKSTNSFKTK